MLSCRSLSVEDEALKLEGSLLTDHDPNKYLERLSHSMLNFRMNVVVLIKCVGVKQTTNESRGESDR